MGVLDSPEGLLRLGVVVAVTAALLVGLNRMLKDRIPPAPRRLLVIAVVVGLIVLAEVRGRARTRTYRSGDGADGAAELPLTWSAIDLFMSEMIADGVWEAPLALRLVPTAACPEPPKDRPTPSVDRWLSEHIPDGRDWPYVKLHFDSFGSRPGEEIEMSATQTVGIIYTGAVSIEEGGVLRLQSIEKGSFPVSWF